MQCYWIFYAIQQRYWMPDGCPFGTFWTYPFFIPEIILQVRVSVNQFNINNINGLLGCTIETIPFSFIYNSK